MPSGPSALTSTGIFLSDNPEADKFRTRLVSTGLEWFRQCQQDRWKQERQWYLNLAFYYGNHWVQFRNVSGSSTTFDLWVPPAPYYRVRATINQVRKFVRKEISRLTAQKPNAYVVPASTEDEDVFAAQAGEQIWDSLWRRLRFNRTLRQSVFWQAVCGNGYIKQYWDPTKKDQEHWGDIVIQPITPFHIYIPDLMQENLEDQPYVIHAQVKPVSWVKKFLGMDAQSRSLEIDDSLRSIMGLANKKDQTVVLEVWVKPGVVDEMPDGGMFTIVESKIVQGFDQWPYSHEEYPFSKLDGVASGKYYNSSVVEDLIPLQRELNRTRSQIIEAKNKMAKPSLFAQRGSIIAKAITTEPGQVIEVKPGFDYPQPVPLSQLPAYVTQEVERIYTDMADIAGQHEVSQGTVPPGVTAATAISFLTEQDESLIANHFDSLEESIERTARQCLGYVHDFWDEERTVKVVGLEGSFDVQVFKGSDISGNTDIRVEAGSALPTSRAAKQAFITDMMKMGWVDPQQGLEVMEIGGLNRIYERTQIDRRQAQRENLKMRVVTEDDVRRHNEEWMASHPELQRETDTGLQLDPPLIIPVHSYDNHQVHIEEHNQYRKSQYFETASPITRIMFEEHVKQHQEALAGTLGSPLGGGLEMGAPMEGQEGQQEMPPQEGQQTPGPEAMPQTQSEAVFE
jgi:hypothetical protein